MVGVLLHVDRCNERNSKVPEQLLVSMIEAVVALEFLENLRSSLE